ncbi:unnamed protein product [Arabidopsis halleri]
MTIKIEAHDFSVKTQNEQWFLSEKSTTDSKTNGSTRKTMKIEQQSSAANINKPRHTDCTEVRFDWPMAIVLQ